MNKGFTLIELLAVIVIVAIIATITSPMITNVIETSNEKAFKSSIEEMINIIDMDYNEYARSKEVTYKYSNNKLLCSKCNNGSDLELDFTGEIKNGSGTIIYNNGKVTSLNIQNNKYKASISNNKVITTKK